MKVRDLIEILKTYDQDMLVAYKLFSEQCLLEKEHLKVESLCVARPDGWIQDARPDMEAVDYLVFPGN
jgi:hypothetical protein